MSHPRPAAVCPPLVNKESGSTTDNIGYVLLSNYATPVTFSTCTLFSFELRILRTLTIPLFDVV